MTDLSHLRRQFDALLEVAEPERIAWLSSRVETADDRATLARWLAADDAEGFLDRSLQDRLTTGGSALGATEAEFAPETLIGRRFGAFRLVQLLGQGGMATVFRATREGGDFAQDVALKLLRNGLHDATAQRLFRRERNILARLQHPDIARLIDGGISAEGVPYLAMELVEGRAIDTWCRERCKNPAERLRLFVRVCAAVDAAHRALIVHRDLKPANVLVTDDGQVKVLDFGIACLLEPDDEVRTEPALRRMTPVYAAPEQIACGAITLATDVHALGVMLAELVLGARPKLTRAGAPLSLPGKLPGELHWIYAKATHSDAGQRYRCAAELGDDVARWLGGMPVLAHPPSRLYELGKLLQRQRTAFALIALTAIVLIATSALSWRSARRADHEAARASAAAATASAAQDFLVSMFENAKGEQPQTELLDTRQLLERGLQRLRQDETAVPALTQQLLASFVDIFRSLNDLDRADEISRWQLEHASKHFGSTSKEMALAHFEAGRNARFRALWENAVAELELALPILQREMPGSVELALVLAELGAIMTSSSRYAQADAYYAQAQRLLEPYCTQGQAQQCRDLLSIGLAGGVNLGMRGESRQAYDKLRELLRVAQQSLGPRHLVTAQIHYNIAAAASGMGDAEVAVEHARSALTLSLALGDIGRDNATHARNVLALAQAYRGAWRAAADEYAILVGETAAAWPHGHANLALYRANWAEQLIQLGEYPEALEQIALAQAWYRQEVPMDHIGVARTLEQTAQIAEAQDDLQAALIATTEAVRLRDSTPEQRRSKRVDALLLRARIEQRLGRAELALRSARAAVQIVGDGETLGPARRAAFSAILNAVGQQSEARREAETVVETQRLKPLASEPQRCEVAILLSSVLASVEPVEACGRLLAGLDRGAPLARAYARSVAELAAARP